MSAGPVRLQGYAVFSHGVEEVAFLPARNYTPTVEGCDGTGVPLSCTSQSSVVLNETHLLKMY